MKMSYFDDTDTLYIELKNTDVADTKDLDENTILDLDSQGKIIGITVEHASTLTDVRSLKLSGIAA